MSETGTEKSETVLIGDTVFDMEMAVNAGVGVFGVAWGYHDTAELKAAGALVILDQLNELPSVLERRREKS